MHAEYAAGSPLLEAAEPLVLVPDLVEATCATPEPDEPPQPAPSRDNPATTPVSATAALRGRWNHLTVAVAALVESIAISSPWLDQWTLLSAVVRTGRLRDGYSETQTGTGR
jgi:hypothetical protein